MNITQKTTVNKSSRGSWKPCLIVWHIAEGTYNGTIAWEQNPQSETSSHFVLGKNGEITQLVPLEMAAWTQGKVANPTHPYVRANSGVNPNLYCISIECEGRWSENKGKLTDKQLAAAAELTKHIVAEVKRIYGAEIPIDRQHMIGHCEINSVTRPHCPGELFPFDELISMAGGKVPEIKPQPPQTDSLHYTVQAGAFTSWDNAFAFSKKLSDMGYFTYIKGVNSTDRVCVGRFATQAEAQKTADDLNKKGFGGFVTSV